MDSKLLFERAPLTKLLSVALAILDQDVSVARKKLGIHQNKSDCNLMTDRDVQGGVSDEKAATVLCLPWLFASHPPNMECFVLPPKFFCCYLLDWRCPPWSVCLRSPPHQTREARWWHWWSSPVGSSLLSPLSSLLSSSRHYFFSLFHFPRNMSQATHTQVREMSTAWCDKSSVTLETNPILLPWQIRI